MFLPRHLTQMQISSAAMLSIVLNFKAVLLKSYSSFSPSAKLHGWALCSRVFLRRLKHWEENGKLSSVSEHMLTAQEVLGSSEIKIITKEGYLFAFHANQHFQRTPTFKKPTEVKKMTECSPDKPLSLLQGENRVSSMGVSAFLALGIIQC